MAALEKMIEHARVWPADPAPMNPASTLQALADALEQLRETARVVVDEWRADNPFLGYAIEALETNLDAEVF